MGTHGQMMAGGSVPPVGLVKIRSELIGSVGVPGSRDVWLQQCRGFNATRARPVDEVAWVWTNASVQCALVAIHDLALVGVRRDVRMLELSARTAGTRFATCVTTPVTRGTTRV